jgi:acetyl esterase/lipase
VVSDKAGNGRHRRTWWGAVAATFFLLVTAAVPIAVPVAAAAPPPVTPVTAAYGPSPYETVTIYPAAVPGSPLVIMVHGGGWESSLTTIYQPSQAQALRAAGAAVFVINYDRTVVPVGAFPVQVDEVTAATGWAVAHAADYDADPANVELLGGSAGGQLAMMAAERMDTAVPGSVRAVVTLSGALDLVALMNDVAVHSVSGYLGFHLRQALACGSKASPCTAAVESAWSPAQQLTRAGCPAASLVVNDTQELMPVEQADAMVSALRAGGCTATELLQPGRQHSFNGWHAVAGRVLAFVMAN